MLLYSCFPDSSFPDHHQPVTHDRRMLHNTVLLAPHQPASTTWHGAMQYCCTHMTSQSGRNHDMTMLCKTVVLTWHHNQEVPHYVALLCNTVTLTSQPESNTRHDDAVQCCITHVGSQLDCSTWPDYAVQDCCTHMTWRPDCNTWHDDAVNAVVLTWNHKQHVTHGKKMNEILLDSHDPTIRL